MSSHKRIKSSARVLQGQTKNCIGGVKLSLNENQTYAIDWLHIKQHRGARNQKRGTIRTAQKQRLKLKRWL